MLCFVTAHDEAATIEVLCRHPAGAVTIGRVSDDAPGAVLMETAPGSTYIVDIPAGEELPRIC
jgi:hydrogenase expression/formation protein HypE